MNCVCGVCVCVVAMCGMCVFVCVRLSKWCMYISGVCKYVRYVCREVRVVARGYVSSQTFNLAIALSPHCTIGVHAQFNGEVLLHAHQIYLVCIVATKRYLPSVLHTLTSGALE